MAALAGASGARSWLQTHHMGWLTPRRLRALTVTGFVVAMLGSSVTLSSSTTTAQGKPATAAHASR